MMRKSFLTTVFFCFMLMGKAQNYNELVEQAMDYALRDSLAKAESLFRQALKCDPANARNALLFSNLGTVQKRQGKLDEAIESYTMALNITPYSTTMLLNRAALYLEKNLFDKAYIDYCNVIDLLPKNIEARMFRAYIYMNRRQYKEARIDYNMILAEDMKNKSARLGIIMLDEKEGRSLAARDGLNGLLEDYPEDASLLKMRANLEIAQNQLDAAFIDLEEALKIDCNDAEAYLMKGDLCLRMKKKKEARAAYEQAVNLGIPRVELLEKLKQCK